MAQTTSQFSPNDDDSGDDLQDTAFVSRGCCFFVNFPCFNSRRPDNWQRISTSEGDRQEGVGRNWWGKSTTVLMKVREWSELLAGPKWKTFIRRFNRTAVRTKSGKFQYDPMSYALNFDEGPGQNGQFDDDRIFRDFSSRYSAIRGQSIQQSDAPMFA